MKPAIESISDLERLDDRFQDICSNLIVPPGTLFRIVSSYLEQWGILVTPENAAWIEKRGQESYRTEWRTTPGTSYNAIDNAIEIAGLGHDNKNMNAALANIAARALIEKVRTKDREKKLVVLDVGSGTGGTTGALISVLNIMAPTVLEHCTFLLLEMAFERHVDAMKNTLRGTNAEVLPQTREFYEHFEGSGSGTIDLIISNAVFHHMTTTRYIDLLHSRLRDDGLVIMGDWYTAIWSHPGFFMQVMKELGANARELLAFQQEFDVSDWQTQEEEERLGMGERETNRQMKRFVKCLADQMQRVPRGERLLLLEGHERFTDRMKKFDEGGFLTVPGELATKYTEFVRGSIARMYRGRDFATVVGIAKKPL
ncbi:MAG: methyltransferase domain-containing protein [Candidatus Micrarchaeota archaeon]